MTRRRHRIRRERRPRPPKELSPGTYEQVERLPPLGDDPAIDNEYAQWRAVWGLA